jgi:hypothetical protein
MPSPRSRLSRVDPALSLLIAAVLTTALLTWSGFRSARAAGERRGALARARSELRAFDDLRGRYAPAVAAESLSWRTTWVRLQDMGILGSDRLELTGAVSRVAEEAGLRDVRVRIGPPDTTGLETRLSTEGIQRKPAPFGLLVEARGGMQSVIGFIGRLPPSVAVTQLSLVRQDGGRRHRISLAVYELEFTNGSPPIPSDLWSPVERGPAPGGNGGRPGG